MKKLLPWFSILLLLFSCKKESFTYDSNAFLSTSSDSLHFDTVFTSTGSVMESVKIINNNNKGIHIRSISLAGGNSSSFHINVDGIEGPVINNIDLAANDSTYIFVTVKINSNNSGLPFIIGDSIKIDYNGNSKWIQLDAYGQNAHFYRNKLITGNITWDSDLPYVILGSLVVDSGSSLTINKGCRIYIHADAPLLINGSLSILGTDSSRVIMTGDRLDDPYAGFPASYPGIFFSRSSADNTINYAIIKNAYQAIVSTDLSSSAYKLSLNETIIDNAYDAGLIALNTSISATNLLISNCGKNIVLVNGGNYAFNHCTAASYSNSFLPHKDPVLIVSDYLYQNVVSNNNLNATFRNCIFWGDNNGFVDNEVTVLKNGTGNFNVIFDHVLWRIKDQPTSSSIINSLNTDPLFDSINVNEHYYNFRLKDNSPAVNVGIDAGIKKDLDGKIRPVGLPDLGCYEKQ